MKIINGNVFNEDGKFVEKEVYTEGERFSDRSDNEEIIDAEGAYVIPGLTDVHFHGCIGLDVCDAKSGDLERIARFQAENGVTQIIPATMTVSRDHLRKIFRVVGETEVSRGAMFMGIHMEGPFISEHKVGAQNPEYVISSDIEFFKELQELSKNRIKLISIAPETEAAMDFIEEISKTVTISVAHTVSDYETAKEAFEKGATHVTHLFNAMPPFSHREPGVIGAAFDHKEVMAELICDGVHIHPSVIRATFSMFGKERMILVSDSMRATGLGDGNYDLGGQMVEVKGNLARLPGGAIAGSVTGLFDCLRFAVKAGIPLEDAVLAATHNPAKNIGIWDEVGGIREGKWANFVIMDRELQIKAVYVKGKRVYNKVSGFRLNS